MERTSESGVTLNQPRCPFCHDEIEHGAAQLACNLCRAWHHQECWAECGRRCAACGSQETGFGDSDDGEGAVSAPGLAAEEEVEEETPPPHDQEFRFDCSDCGAHRWAFRLHVGERAACVSCGVETEIPEVPEDAMVASGTWQSNVRSELVVGAFLALVVAVFVWGCAFVWGMMGVEFSLQGDAFCYGFTIPYLLITGLVLLITDDRPHTPRKRILAAGALSGAAIVGAWAAWFDTWLIALLLPHWPLIGLTFFGPYAPPPPPPPEVPETAPEPKKVPLKGED